MMPGMRMKTWKPAVGALAAATLMSLPHAAPAQSIEEKTALCAACHGDKGVPIDKDTPVIWGQTQGYLYFQLRDYKSGTRKDDRMSPVAQMLERPEMLALAEYFSKQPWPALGQPQAPADVAARAQRTNTAVACTGCHQGEYQGEGTQPRLAGQWKDYLLRTMLDFRTRKRGNNPGMSDLMLATPEEELALMAEYLAGR
jgi:cytochrome c553